MAYRLGRFAIRHQTSPLGAVGYLYQQITPDRGAAIFLGNNEARVVGIGPQFGYIFPAGSLQGYLNLKAYWEFRRKPAVGLGRMGNAGLIAERCT